MTTYEQFQINRNTHLIHIFDKIVYVDKASGG